MFDLESFVATPTLDQLDSCCKDDLAKIADHFSIIFSKTILKRDLKALIIGKLVEMEVLVLPLPSGVEIPVFGGDTMREEAGDHNLEDEPWVAQMSATASGGASVRAKTPRTLPRYDPLSPTSPGSRDQARLKVRIARLHLETEEKVRDREAKLKYQLELEVRKLEIEANKTVRLRELELQSQRETRTTSTLAGSTGKSLISTTLSNASFDISKHIALVPTFRESEVDSYFGAFERIAAALQWPAEVWPLLLQCKIHGKAQEAVAALPLADSLDYECVKVAVLRAYELVPEAYRQKFRGHKKTQAQTHVEFAREKCILFDKWINSCKMNKFESLKELILLEEFKNCVPDRIVVYLNEQKVQTLSAAAVLADEYMLTHKTAFLSVPAERARYAAHTLNTQPKTQPMVKQDSDRVCFYCHKPGHVIADCRTYKRKSQPPSPQRAQPKGIGLIKVEPRTPFSAPGKEIDSCFKPFVFDGLVSLTGEPAAQRPVRILRDTGGSHSVILASALPFSKQSACGYGAVLRGIEMGYSPTPVHRIHVQSPLVTGFFPVAVCKELPIKGVTFLMGNDIAGGKVNPVLEVLESPPLIEDGNVSTELFPSCAITQSQARKVKTADVDVPLFDSVLMSALSEESNSGGEPEKAAASRCALAAAPVRSSHVAQPSSDSLSLPVTRERLGAAQRADPTLSRCFSSVVSNNNASGDTVKYLVENDVLMRKWSPAAAESDSSAVYQIVVPSVYRPLVLSVAHESQWSGHLGITKTYQLILKHFFWPGLKSDVASYCRCCHVCQIAGKPNQTIPQAPLHPIPAMGEPFERVLIDCVGPLPRTKSGNQYILTIMCAATRFPEAVPLRKITANSVVRALTKFFSMFGLPKIIQSDQGTNFQSRVFKQVLRVLNVKHATSSAYHPESQGALERWHQTLKSMLRKYCLETAKSWDEGIPFVLFAAREAVQESLGFSPAELVFGHVPRGPLKSLKDRFLCTEMSPGTKVLEYVSRFRERLHRANSFAKRSLSSAQTVMKRRFDRAAVPRCFERGDKVLALLPITGSTLSAKFSGPYEICERLSDTNYTISTPERRRKTRVCHINMLKRYHSHAAPNTNSGTGDAPPPAISGSSALIVAETADVTDRDDGLVLRPSAHQSARLPNSKMLLALPAQLHHLTDEQQSDVLDLVKQFPCLFNDVPSRTNVLKHDIDVKGARPMKQHHYRVNPVKRALMKQEAQYLIQHGLAIPSSSPWSSPCLLEAKTDGSPRFITDFRKVNAVTVPDSYPLPRMEDCVDNLGTATFVSKLDLLKGYWQVPLTEHASTISAFVTPDHFLQYTVMAFGMCNAPATFQRLVDTVLAGVPACNAYLDDLIVYSSTWEEHMQILEQVFGRLADASLTLNLAKCEFGKATVSYLGRKVGQGQVRPLEAKVAAIVDYPVPPNRRALRRFLGMAGYYRNFCRNFSVVVRPLTNLLSPKVDFVWSPDCQHAFESVKSLLCHAPVLAAPDLSRPFKLEVDASAVGAGAVLLQEDATGVDRPVCYFSRKFLKHQLAYSTIEKETLALLLSLQHFEVYVGSSACPVVVMTDHNPLTFLSRMYNHNQRLMRWALIVQEYNLEIRHKKGTDNVLADALSRLW